MARIFFINNPVDGERQEIFYNKNQDKNMVLQKAILDYWEDYCNTHWLWQNKFEETRFNYEDKVKGFLSTCATFLLLDSFKDSNTLTKDAINKIKTNEYSLDGDWGNEDIEIEPSETVEFLNKHIRDKYLNDGKMLTSNFDNISPSSSKKESNTSRMNKIYSFEGKTIHDYKNIHISNTFSVWEKTDKKIKARKGIIDKSKPYISEWCIVDTENEFMFQGDRYKICNNVNQYSPRTKKPNYDDYKNDYQMDKILVYKQCDTLYFFNQNIEKINNNLINKI